MQRKLAKIIHGQPVIEGAGVHLHRVFGFGKTELFDPFLLFDDFRSDNPREFEKGFPWHPHRGIETITYVTKGEVAHGDSLGNSGTIGDGEVQWMTAGGGIIHQEMPLGDGQGSMHGFQLWANLPAARKMMTPRYLSIQAADIPQVEMPGGIRVKIIAGELAGVRGPAAGIEVDPEYFDVQLPPRATFTHTVHAGYTAFLYVIDGAVIVDGEILKNRSLALFGDGNQLQASSGELAGRFLFCSGRPLKEPVAWRGPIVMNSRAELEAAFAEIEAGTFVRQAEG